MSDTGLTQARSWIVRDNDDNAWGPFDTAGEATRWATAKWPDIPQYDPDHHNGHGCWDIEALRSPT